NNRGYQISLEYARDDAANYAQWGQWIRIKKVTAFNRIIDSCEPTAKSCSFSRIWPNATFDTSHVSFQTATDALNQTTKYEYYYGFLKSVTRAGDADPIIALTYSGRDGSVLSHSNGIETYSYNFSDSGSARTATIVDPLGRSSRAVSDISTGKLRSLTDPMGQSRIFSYDTYGRLQSVTQPAGNSIGYKYDSRGNVVEIRASPKPGFDVP
ncbi:hypothetical protein GTY49_40195, partial [Streptomyces sp. SID5477]|nr:hypothetical protein [Streptomyces sp. SID5477]